MRHLHSRAWAAVAAAIALTTLGCGGDDEASSEGSGRETGDEATDAGADAELVTWMDGFCEARSALDLPAPLVLPDPITEADRQPVLDFLADMQAALVAADEAAAALPPAPVPAGDDLVASYRADLEALRSEMAEYAGNAAVFPLDGLAAVYRLSGVSAVSFLPGGEGLSDYLEGHDDLTEAHEQASACS